jgi:hypothetical protein
MGLTDLKVLADLKLLPDVPLLQTVPDACAKLNQKLHECIRKNGFTGRVMGTCVELKNEFEKCSNREVCCRMNESMAICLCISN